MWIARSDRRIHDATHAFVARDGKVESWPASLPAGLSDNQAVALTGTVVANAHGVIPGEK